MIEMIPNLLSEDTKSQAEVKLFREFQNFQTEENYIILHSLGISEHVNNIFGEIDFVIICSKGVLCIEVKGGEVRCNRGVWEFINRYGKKNCKAEGPFQQVQGNMQSLRTYMMKRLGKYDPLVSCQYASCVIMPDCNFEYKGIEIIPEILFDKSNYINLDQVVNDSFLYWTETLRNRYGFEGNGLSDDDMDRCAKLLRGDFHFVPSMKDDIESTTKALCALTDEQYDVLESLADNERTLVSGVAGAGKTLLAMEQARRIFWSGKSVLYICFNKNISGYVQYQFEKEGINVVARTLHSILAEDVDIEDPTSQYFEEVLPGMFLKKSDILEYDYLVVDEGQDLFRDAYIPCLEKILKGGLQDGCWLIFYDQNQNLYNNNDQFNSSLERLKSFGAASYKLSVNCRNTKQIADANVLTTGFSDIGRTKVNGISVKYIPYKDKQEEQQILKDILKTLKSEGICGNDLILLSRYAVTNLSNCLHDITLDRSIGVLKTEGQIWKAKKTDIRFSTISSFKGLEAKTVILMDVDGFLGQNQRLLNYVAISRACALLYILYDSSKEEDRQNMMIGVF